MNVEGLQEVFKLFAQRLDEIDQRFEDLGSEIKAVKQTEDEKVASQFVMPTWKILSSDVEEDNEEIVERLKDNIPEQEEEAESVLDTMFWKPFLGTK